MLYLHVLTLVLHMPVFVLSIIVLVRGLKQEKRHTLHAVDTAVCICSGLVSAFFVKAQVVWIKKNRDSQITDLESIDWILFDLSLPVVLLLILIRLSLTYRECKC